MTDRTVSISELQKELGPILDALPWTSVVITRRGRPIARLTVIRPETSVEPADEPEDIPP
jgi:prevent-host-death family protein